MANGSVSGGSKNWSASKGTRAAARAAKRLSRSERRVYDHLRSEGLSDAQARQQIASMRNVRGEVPF